MKKTSQIKRALQVKQTLNFNKKGCAITYIETTGNKKSENDASVSKPFPNPPIKPTTNNKTVDNKTKTNPAVAERMKKRQKIAFWSVFTLLLIGGIAFWQALSVFTPPVKNVTKIETDGVGTLEKPANVKFTFNNNNNDTFILSKNTKVQIFWGATTAQLSLHIDVFLFQGFIINARYIGATDQIQIANYTFDALTGIGNPIPGNPGGIIENTVLNQLSTQMILNATAQMAKFNPLLTIISFLPMILLIGILFWSMKKMSGGSSSNESVFNIGKFQQKVYDSEVKFSDVAGIEEEKLELMEIVDYLREPNKYATMGARTPKGVMLYGPPGTGKTLLAKAVAGESNVPFFQASGSSFEDMLVGVGAKRIRDLFAKASKAAPSIIFIDEIDSVASKRGKFDSSGGVGDQTINQLLSEMDGFQPNNGVVVMAATNRLDVLDPAVIRPGRFDRHIAVNLPDIKERTEILKIHARNKNISANVNLEDIARRTPGFSGAQLENVLNEATLLAVRENKTVVSTKDIDEAIDRVIGGPSKRSRIITAHEKKQIAYHEAGHALVGLHTPGADVVQKITIIPRGNAAGYTLSTPEKQELSIQRKSDLLGIIASTLGGRAAEEVIYGSMNVSTGASNDLFKVSNIVRSMVTQLGMSDLGMTQFIPSEGTSNPYQNKLYSDDTAKLIDKEVEKIIATQYEYSKNIIKKNKKELDLIVDSLIILETITKNQIDYIHKELKLPKEALEKQRDIIKEKKESK
ncbi:MAG: ATP-dependent zinc metalloprotease FtsH [Mycoplasmoidaceae bacterium]